MRSDQDRLTALIEAVADSFSLTSDGIEPLSDEDRRFVDHLRLVAAIAQVHRTLGAGETESSQLSAALGAPDTRRWGDLVLVEKVGAGAFGEVWRANDPLLETDVALKLFPRSHSKGMNSRVLHEARALAKLRHPNVVTVLGVEKHGEEIGLRMEFIHGSTLEDLLRQHGPLGPRETAAISLELCSALAAVHRAGLLHRDIKARNVMRATGGRVVLMDLGSGLLVEEAARATGLAGTPLYLAPEVLNGQPATEQSDIYSVGVLMYHLLTNDYPARAESVDGLRDVHNRRRLRYLRSLRPDVPADLARIVDDALASDPAQRPATAGELASRLSRYLDPSARSQDRSSLSRRGWLVAAVTAALVGLLVAGLGYRSTSRAPGATPTLVAVLPFQSSALEPELAYLASALSLELTSMLGHVGALNVVPWSVVNSAKPDSIDSIARSTGADMIVEGSVHATPPSDGRQRVYVRAQMFRASTGTLVWTAAIERDLGEFFALQADLARQLTRQIQVVLARREEMLLERSRRVSAQAMELYLKGRLAWETYAGDFSQPIELFRRAIELEPGFAEAYAALAECYALQHSYAGTVDSREALARVLEHADKAIAIDPTQPDAWATRAFAKLALAWDWEGAEADYLEARRLSASSATVAGSYANYLITMRRFDEAIEISRQAWVRSPLSPVVSRKLAWAFYVAGRYDDAIAQLHRTLEIDASHEPAITLLARAYALKGLPQQAVAQMRDRVRPGFEPLMAQVYAASGQREAAEATLAEAISPERQGPLLRYQIAAAYAALANEEEAMRWLHEAIAFRDSGVSLVAADPMFGPIRHTSSFANVLEQLRLPNH